MQLRLFGQPEGDAPAPPSANRHPDGGYAIIEQYGAAAIIDHARHRPSWPPALASPMCWAANGSIVMPARGRSRPHMEEQLTMREGPVGPWKIERWSWPARTFANGCRFRPPVGTKPNHLVMSPWELSPPVAGGRRGRLDSSWWVCAGGIGDSSGGPVTVPIHRWSRPGIQSGRALPDPLLHVQFLVGRRASVGTVRRWSTRCGSRHHL